MATAKKLPSGKYRALVYIGTFNGKRKYKSFTAGTKKEAEYLASEYLMTNKTKNEPLSITLGEAYDRYIESKEFILSPASIREYKRARKRVFPLLMDVRLSDLSQEMIQNAINQEAKTLSWKTVRDIHGMLASVLNVYLPSLRLNTVLPKKRIQDIYVPSDDEIKKIIDAVKGKDIEVPILLAAFGSLRRSEISALDILDESTCTIHVNKAMVQNEFKEWVIKPPKTTCGDRYVTLPQFVVNVLTRERLENGRFTNMNPNQITKRFSIVLKQLGIPHFKFHALRHYNASIMLAMGVPDKYAAARGGWGSNDVMKKVYQHLIDEKKIEVDNMLNSHFEKLVSK